MELGIGIWGGDSRTEDKRLEDRKHGNRRRGNRNWYTEQGMGRRGKER